MDCIDESSKIGLIKIRVILSVHKNVIYIIIFKNNFDVNKKLSQNCNDNVMGYQFVLKSPFSKTEKGWFRYN